MAVLPGVEVAIRDLTARRLARAYLGLAVLGALAIGEWLLTGRGASQALWVLLGTPTSAGALLAVGWRGVRMGAGEPPAPWMTAAAVAGVLPWVHGLFVLTVPGLRRLAWGGWGADTLLLGGAYTVLGLRLLRDTLRVAEVGRLGAAMAIPVADEARG